MLLTRYKTHFICKTQYPDPYTNMHAIKNKTQPQSVQNTTFQGVKDMKKMMLLERLPSSVEDLKLVYPKPSNKHLMFSQDFYTYELTKIPSKQPPWPIFLENIMEFLHLICKLEKPSSMAHYGRKFERVFSSLTSYSSFILSQNRFKRVREGCHHF